MICRKLDLKTGSLSSFTTKKSNINGKRLRKCVVDPALPKSQSPASKSNPLFSFGTHNPTQHSRGFSARKEKKTPGPCLFFGFCVVAGARTGPPLIFFFLLNTAKHSFLRSRPEVFGKDELAISLGPELSHVHADERG